MKNVLLVLAIAGGLAAAPAVAADKPAKEHVGKGHADEEHAEKMKEKCAEMMEHEKAPAGGVANADKKGCGMMIGKKKGLQKEKGGDEHADHDKKR